MVDHGLRRSIVVIFLVWSNCFPTIGGTGSGRQAKSSTVWSSIKANELYLHLTQLENIAKNNNLNRAIQTLGFNLTVDYIEQYLKSNTILDVQKEEFYYRTFQLSGSQSLSSTIDGKRTNYAYSTLLSLSDFSVGVHSMPFNRNQDFQLLSIPNFGCSESDWSSFGQSLVDRVAIVKRGDCTFVEKALIATKYKVAALLIYNDGLASDRFQPITINLGEENEVACLFLSYSVGQTLATAAKDPSKSVTIRLTISAIKTASPVSNICAHTRTGDPTKIILLGSHMDSVPAGPGINDNGSGTSVNLVVAKGISRLLDDTSLPPFPYRIRFCWWGAEEVGLIGSSYHATQAKQSTVVGQRLSDYLVNINLDMVGSPNFVFAIYNGNTAPSTTPASAKPGSNKMTILFRDWFVQNQLPYDYTQFDGRSDYGPFLAAGVVAGGLFTGADETKTSEQRLRYESMLGPGYGGISGIRLDACYHRSCDNTENINKLALETMLNATASALDSLISENDLRTWLYPTRHSSFDEPSLPYQYNSVNEYFRIPYL